MLRRLIPIVLLLVLFPAAAQAQCTGQAPTKTYCGNDGLTTALPSFKTISSMPFPNVAGGTVVGNRTTSAAAATGLTNPILGIPGTSTGEIGFAGATSGTVTIKPQAAAGTYNFNLPTSAGTAGQPLLSGGGGAAAQTYGTLQVPAGGTGLTSGTSGGILYFNSSTTIASSAALTANAIVLGGGAGTAPVALGSLGTTTTVLHGNAAGAPTFAAVSLTADVTGVLPEANGGTNQSTYTLGDTLYASGANTLSKLAGSTTTTIKYLAQTGTGTISAAPAWTTISGSDITGAALTKVDDTNVTLTLGGTPTTALLRAASLTLGWTGQLGLSRGGTAANLTASNGGLVYSTSSALAILSGTATANQIPLSGSSAAPTWSTATYPSTAAAGTLLAAATANTIAATAAPTLGANGGTGGQITFNGSTSGSVQLKVAAAAGTGTIFQLPATNGTNTYVLQTDGAGITSWVPSVGGGTITSITCAASLTCTASNPITTTGTITLNVGNANSWTAAQTFDSSIAKVKGSSTGVTSIASANSGASNYTATFQAASGTLAYLDLASQTISGGATVTSNSIATGSFTVDCGARPLHYVTNNGAYTITAPAADGSCMVLVTNGASAGATTFSGFTVSSNTGDSLTTTNTSKFVISIVRINGTSTYIVKALQ